MVIEDHSKNGGPCLIPPGWQVKAFGDIFEFSGGFSASRDQLSEVGHCYLHYGDIHGSDKSWVDTKADLQDIPKLDISLKLVSSASLLQDGDVVFVDASEDNDGTSKHIVVVNKFNVPFISGLHTIVAKSKTDELTHEYRRYCFQAYSIKQQFLFYVVGTKVSGISKSNIRNILIAVPPINEQLRISQVLIDIDALLAKLNKAIAKKRDMKQAVMQELLTGKTRLTGFDDTWSNQNLKSVGQFIRGVSYQGDTDLSPHDKSYTKRLLRSNNIQNAFVITNDIQFVNKKRVSEAQILKKNDILICMANGSKSLVGKSGLFNIEDGFDYTFGAFMGVFRVNEELAFPNFVFFLFQTSKYKNYINNLLAGSSINNLTSGIIDSLEFNFPSYPEQKAIAMVLSNMDDELLKLEDRRNKTKELKQAMMQELLTGKIRLINEEPSDA